MKGFFDTSVPVPVLYGDHVHHQASLQLFLQFDKATGCCGAHSSAEIFSTLTRMPGKHRTSGEHAMRFIGSLCERPSLVALDGEEYARALGASASLGIVGGGIYDVMLAHCAIKAQEPRPSTLGMAGIMRSADRKSRDVCKRPESNEPK
jgi:hypothetical protein